MLLVLDQVLAAGGGKQRCVVSHKASRQTWSEAMQVVMFLQRQYLRIPPLRWRALVVRAVARGSELPNSAIVVGTFVAGVEAKGSVI
jgi:hypothetical protein